MLYQLELVLSVALWRTSLTSVGKTQKRTQNHGVGDVVYPYVCDHYLSIYLTLHIEERHVSSFTMRKHVVFGPLFFLPHSFRVVFSSYSLESVCTLFLCPWSFLEQVILIFVCPLLQLETQLTQFLEMGCPQSFFSRLIDGVLTQGGTDEGGEQCLSRWFVPVMASLCDHLNLHNVRRSAPYAIVTSLSAFFLSALSCRFTSCPVSLKGRNPQVLSSLC